MWYVDSGRWPCDRTEHGVAVSKEAALAYLEGEYPKDKFTWGKIHDEDKYLIVDIQGPGIGYGESPFSARKIDLIGPTPGQ